MEGIVQGLKGASEIELKGIRAREYTGESERDGDSNDIQGVEIC